ncbi:hypothetical protein EZ449_01810 [Pedobacter frigidisoli]|uniref:GLPGLI family protein n=1 Tax=Pedobacter frigidisoli TaxID=2530455 RepID=A0A4V2MNH4_9SPHI|nr:hypothetical protein [Pedobacter frigidisoli]TCD12806.1 hypothetical protein EZ449_01810 [Pedobacter frigidisoli]
MKGAITILLFTISSYSFAQKAFEFEYYYGKTKNFEIKLSLANGYILGSEIIKTDLKTSRKIKYIPNDNPDRKSQSLMFLPDSTDRTVRRRKRDNIILYNMKDDYQVLPDKIRGVYGIDLGTFKFTLYKQKTTH